MCEFVTYLLIWFQDYMEPVKSSNMSYSPSKHMHQHEDTETERYLIK